MVAKKAVPRNVEKAHQAKGRGTKFLLGGAQLFSSKEHREIADALDRGLAEIENRLRQELSFTDEIADSVSRYLFDAGGKRVRPLCANH
jgi:Geranylgeranyl pyrophosphate synthase